jgi:multidrug resistance efflux pump
MFREVTPQQNANLKNLSQQQQEYAQQVQNKKYQLAQLELSLPAIEDKLNQIPIVRSPSNGYIRPIKN